MAQIEKRMPLDYYNELENGSITLGMIKPDIFDTEGLKILNMIQENGFEFLGLKMINNLSIENAKAFYGEHKSKPFFEDLVSFMTSGVLAAFVLRKYDGVQEFRKLIGNTDPNKAEIGTVRKIFGESIDRNAIHGSDSPSSAAREIPFFFSVLELKLI